MYNKKKDFTDIGLKIIRTLLFFYGLIILYVGCIVIVGYSKIQKTKEVEFKDILSVSANLGDILGGVLGTLIAIVASLLTFWALMAQVNANKQQKKQFKKQFIDQQKASFENRLFELLKIHRDNTNYIHSNFTSGESFQTIFNELEYLYFHEFVVKHKELSLDDMNKNWITNINVDSISKNEHISDREKILSEETISLKVLLEIIMHGVSSLINETYPTYKYNDFLLDMEVIRNVKFLPKSHPEINLVLEAYEKKMFKIGVFDPDDSVRHIRINLFNNKFALAGYGELLIPYYSNFINILNYINITDIINSKEKEDYFYMITSQLSRFELFLFYYFYMAKYFPNLSKVLVENSKLFSKLPNEYIQFSFKPNVYSLLTELE